MHASFQVFVSIENSLFGIGSVAACEEDVQMNRLTLGSLAADVKIPCNKLVLCFPTSKRKRNKREFRTVFLLPIKGDT